MCLGPHPSSVGRVLATEALNVPNAIEPEPVVGYSLLVVNSSELASSCDSLRTCSPRNG